jgi:hypothetical protein
VAYVLKSLIFFYFFYQIFILTFIKNIQMSCRKPCKQCPWTNSNPHSKKFPSYVKSIENIGKIQDKKHGCHMITKDIWGYESKINNKNICVGAKLSFKN